MLALLFAVCCILIVLLFVRHVKNSGFWDDVQIEVVEKPEIIGQNLEIFYKYHVGPYSKTGEYVKEIKSIVPNARIIAVYYDNPKEVREELCQSICGVIHSVNDNVQIEPHFSENLVRWGFERVCVPAVERSVVCQQKFNGFFSHLHLIWHLYPKITSFFKEHRFKCQLTVEVLTCTRLTVYCPLDHTEEFIVPEVMTAEKLEEKLMSGDFQTESDETDLSDEDTDYNVDEEQTEDENSHILNA